MRKPGTNEDDVQMSDVLCDFCRREWTEDLPIVEGHHGSCLCGKCLTVAYTEVVLNEVDSGPPGYQCTLCLEHRKEPAWRSPAYPEAVACRRCIKQCAGVLQKDKEMGWRKPEAR